MAYYHFASSDKMKASKMKETEHEMILTDPLAMTISTINRVFH